MDMNVSMNVRLHPIGSQDGMVKETFFSGENLAVLVEYLGDSEFAIIAGAIDNAHELHEFFSFMEEATRGD